tara:strand:+ start:1162 stop:1977 length:816 start_codon:yes stop_codon:yes gene_type:complete
MKYKLLSKPATNSKLIKNKKVGVDTWSLSLAHSDLSGFNVCPMAEKINKGSYQVAPTGTAKNKNLSSCSSCCVANNGNAQRFSSVLEARIKKTIAFKMDTENFMDALVVEISMAINESIKKGNIPTFRLNTYSDIQWELIKIEGLNIFELFPNVTMYDYTKIPNRKVPKNYELTYSFWGNLNHLQMALNNNMNVSIVFEKLPKSFLGRKVVDGDKNDLRTIENDGKNVIVGLKFKGSAAKLQDAINEGFAISEKMSNDQKLKMNNLNRLEA